MNKINILLIILILGLAYGVQNKGNIVGQGFSLAADLTIPKSINFQGYLYRDGNPMDTTMDMWFGIYDAPSVGTQLFQQTINNVIVSKGWFTVSLDNIPNSVFPVAGPPRYLEVKAPSSGPALSPRISLVSVGYSYHSITADSAEYAKAAPLSRPITPPIYSTEIRDTTITTAKIKDGAVTSAKILDATIAGVDIASPCSLQGSVSLPNAILNIRNNSNGRGIVIDRVGGNGIYIDSTPSGSGLWVNKVRDYGIYVDSSGNSGVYVNKSGLNGIQVNDAARHGVRVNQADSCGLYVYRAVRNGVYVDSARYGVYVGSAAMDGVYINRADDYGVIVDSAGYSGVLVDRAGTDGVSIDSAGGHGIYVRRVGMDGFYVNQADDCGVWVNSAGNIGVVAHGNSFGGSFFADIASAEGLLVHAYNNVSTDTAIRAYGKGIASGGWSTGFDDGKEAPCIISPELNIIANGTAKLQYGKAEISYPEIFKDNIRNDIPVRINLTPRGEPSGLLYLNKTDANGFQAKLRKISEWGEATDITFDWIAIGTLKEPETSPEAKTEWEKMMREREERRKEKAERRVGGMK